MSSARMRIILGRPAPSSFVVAEQLHSSDPLSNSSRPYTAPEILFCVIFLICLYLLWKCTVDPVILVLQFPYLFWMLRCEIRRFRRVIFQVIQFSAIDQLPHPIPDGRLIPIMPIDTSVRFFGLTTDRTEIHPVKSAIF